MEDNLGNREYLRRQVESASEELCAFVRSIDPGHYDAQIRGGDFVDRLAFFWVSRLLNARRRLMAIDLASVAQVQP